MCLFVGVSRRDDHEALGATLNWGLAEEIETLVRHAQESGLPVALSVEGRRSLPAEHHLTAHVSCRRA